MRPISSNLLFLFLVFCALTGCSSRNAIEKRGNGKSFYLVNYSSGTTYMYTIKETRIENDTRSTTNTREITLGPKSEQFLGFADIELPREYAVIPKLELKTYSLDTSPGKDGLSEGEAERLRDTVIKGERLKYAFVTVMVRDLHHPYPARRFHYDYELAGQKEVK